MQHFFIGPAESGIIPEPAFHTGAGRRHSGKNQIPCGQNSFFQNILVHGIAGFLLKFAHHMVFAQIKAG